MRIIQNSTFLGAEIAQGPRALVFWETLLNSFDFERLIELGTWTGNFSIYLLGFCLQKKADFHTWDKNSHWEKGGLESLKRHFNFENYFHHEDIFYNAGIIGDLILKKGRSIIFCDNGNKPKEFKTFSMYLKPGDLIAVHDWDDEIKYKQTEPICKKYKLKEIFKKEAEEEGFTRVFQKAYFPQIKKVERNIDYLYNKHLHG